VSFSYISKKSYDDLQGRLDHLVKVRRKEIAAQMAHARGFGDLSENAEYDAAKEALAENERRIKELSGRIASVRLVDESKIEKDKVFLGATVKVRDYSENEELEYEMVSPADADILKNKLSVVSPLGKAMLGRKAGETVRMKTEFGVQKYKILAIRR
jgi:transcription elongation factor GreA